MLFSFERFGFKQKMILFREFGRRVFWISNVVMNKYGEVVVIYMI